MAEGFDIERQENPAYTLFAEDLVNFVMFRKSPRYTEEKKLVPISTLIYSNTIYEKFSEFLRKHEVLNEDYTKGLLGIIDMNSSEYRIIVNILEKDLFHNGFTDSSFLNYCIHISTIAALLYNEGVETAPELAKSYIVNVLKNRLPADRSSVVCGVVDNFTLPNGQSSDSSNSNE